MWSLDNLRNNNWCSISRCAIKSQSIILNPTHSSHLWVWHISTSWFSIIFIRDNRESRFAIKEVWLKSLIKVRLRWASIINNILSRDNIVIVIWRDKTIEAIATLTFRVKGIEQTLIRQTISSFNSFFFITIDKRFIAVKFYFL